MAKDEFERKRVLIIEEASTRVKLIIQEAMLLGQPRAYMKNQVYKLIDEVRKKLEDLETDDVLIRQVILAIKQSFMRWYSQMLVALKKIEKTDKLGIVKKTIEALESKGVVKAEAKPKEGAITIAVKDDTLYAGQVELKNIRDYMTIYGDAEFGRYVDYRKMVTDALIDISDNLADGTLTLTDRLGRAKSMRNMAEIQARYNLITDDLERLKARGVKYVIATAHANASERCSWWQGKIFQVDLDISSRPMGQYGGKKPEQKVLGHVDGRPYYSLLQACNNGFLSFNCQHRLIGYYKGVYEPKYDLITVEKRRNLTIQQRALENQIRKWKSREVMAITPQDRLKAIEKSKYYQQRYTDFCDRTGLPNYEWRTRITEEERAFNPTIIK